LQRTAVDRVELRSGDKPQLGTERLRRHRVDANHCCDSNLQGVCEARRRNFNVGRKFRTRKYEGVEAATPASGGLSGSSRAGDRIRTGDVQLGKLAFYP